MEGNHSTSRRLPRPTVRVFDRFLIARLSDGAVVLDATSRSVFAVTGLAALALDILTDGCVVFPRSAEKAFEVRRVVRGLRRELFGERILGPLESISVDGPDGEALLRRFAEPGHWRRAADVSDRYGVVLRGSEPLRPTLRGALVRLEQGGLLIEGDMSTAARIARCFEALSKQVIGRDVVEIERSTPTAPIRFRSRAWDESLLALEVWSVSVTKQQPLKIGRQPPTPALLRMLRATVTRPGERELMGLASCAEAVPNFGLTGPRELVSMATTIAQTHGLVP